MRDILLLRMSGENVGGIEGQVFRIAQYLRMKRLFKPILITSGAESPFAEIFRKDGFSVYEVSMGKTDLTRAVPILESLVQKNDVAVVQSHGFRESLLGASIKKRYPQIPHVFRVQTHIDCAVIAPWRKLAYHILDKINSRYVDCYAVNGRYLADEVVRHSWIPSRKIRIVINGREAVGAPDAPQEQSEDPLPHRIAMVSNLYPRKGHDVLLEALALLKAKDMRVDVRLVGGEAVNILDSRGMSFMDSLRERAARLGVLDQIDFYGFTRDIYTALQGFPIVVLPSDSEGVPNSILEAMSLRKLVIASRVGGIPEIISDGRDGLLHPPKDARSLAQNIERVFCSAARAWEPLRNAAYARWQQEFSMEAMMNQLIDIYENLGVIN